MILKLQRLSDFFQNRWTIFPRINCWSFHAIEHTAILSFIRIVTKDSMVLELPMRDASASRQSGDQLIVTYQINATLRRLLLLFFNPFH